MRGLDGCMRDMGNGRAWSTAGAGVGWAHQTERTGHGSALSLGGSRRPNACQRIRANAGFVFPWFKGQHVDGRSGVGG